MARGVRFLLVFGMYWYMFQEKLDRLYSYLFLVFAYKFTYNPRLYCYYYATCIAQKTFQEDDVASLYGVVTVQRLPMLYIYTILQLSSSSCITQTNLGLGRRDH